jgi:hypothetical protein
MEDIVPSVCRYQPDMKLRFITSLLHFPIPNTMEEIKLRLEVSDFINYVNVTDIYDKYSFEERDDLLWLYVDLCLDFYKKTKVYDIDFHNKSVLHDIFKEKTNLLSITGRIVMLCAILIPDNLIMLFNTLCESHQDFFDFRIQYESQRRELQMFVYENNDRILNELDYLFNV